MCIYIHYSSSMYKTPVGITGHIMYTDSISTVGAVQHNAMVDAMAFHIQDPTDGPK